MTKPHSLDLRERVTERVAAGDSVRAVATIFTVSVASVVRWSQRLRRTGSAAGGKMGGHRACTLIGERGWLMERIAAEPEVTVRGLMTELAERGVAVSYGTVWNFIHREGMSFKKSVLPAEQDRPDVARRRARWKKYQTRIDPARLVFIDETWVKTNMAPIRGWCARGRRLAAKIPHGHWKTMTFLAALRCDRIEAPWVLDGPINGESFRTYVDQVLAPTLKPGDVVILDNLGSHKGKAVRRAIRASGARLLFLPPYSPDLNPIEQVFAKLKHLMRKAKERTVDATWKRTGSLLETFKSSECKNYLVNAGYASS